MATHRLEIQEIIPRTHNVRTYRFEKPAGFQFVPGQAADVSLLKEGWEKEVRPFTFTCLPSAGYLEFTIKSYTDHNGVTNELFHANEGDHLEISDAWGAIEYKGEGTFIAGGAGVTPFIAIFRYLKETSQLGNNKLVFSNKTSHDIILREEFEEMLGENFINIITNEPVSSPLIVGRINKEFLTEHIKDFSQHFYVCGPDAFTESILQALKELGANAETLVFEK